MNKEMKCLRKIKETKSKNEIEQCNDTSKQICHNTKMKNGFRKSRAHIIVEF